MAKKIRITTPIAGAGFAYSIGDEPTVENAVADDFIRAGYAELARTASKPANTAKKSRVEKAAE